MNTKTLAGRAGLIAGLIAAAGAGFVAGCVPAERMRGAFEAQREALERLGRAHEEDSSALAAAVGALAQARAERARLRAEAEIVARYLTSAGAADESALQADIDAGSGSALVDEVRAGRLTRDEALAFLRDYAAAAGLSDAAEYRRALVSRLAAVRREEDAAARTLAAVGARASASAALIDEALHTGASLRDAVEARFAWDEASREAALAAWRAGVARHIPDGEARKAGEELLRAVLSGR